MRDTTHTQNTSEPTNPEIVPPTDLRLTSPIPQTRSVCLPKSEPTISAHASATM